MTACLVGSAVMLAACWAITFLLPVHVDGIGDSRRAA
jgi:hypothetical protein